MNDLWQAYPFLHHRDTHAKPLIGISACLCGDPVRYDGRSKWQPELVNTLEEHLQLEKLCPEVAIGMGIPRPPIRLCRDSGNVEALGVADPRQNFTQALGAYASTLITHQQQAIPEQRLSGYLFKSRSPSCGVGSTPLHERGIEVGLGDGIVAHRLKKQLPWLPVLEEQALNTPAAISRFIFLVYLTDDFFRGKQSVKPFHHHHQRLHRGLPKATQSQLHKIATTQPQQPGHYLSALNQALMGLAADAFSEILPARSS